MDDADLPTAFSLKRFMPLLKDRIFVLNPFTRTFLVGWIVLLDSIPDLELVAYLPEFLGGLLTFLSDTNRDVHIATQNCLDKFLSEIRRIARIKKGIADSRRYKTRDEVKRKRARAGSLESGIAQQSATAGDHRDSSGSSTVAGITCDATGRSIDLDGEDSDDAGVTDEDHGYADDDEDDNSGSRTDGLDEDDSENDWVPGQDVQINYAAILDTLTDTLHAPQGTFPPFFWPNRAWEETADFSPQSLGEDGLLESLRWIVDFLDICPEEVLPFTPKILAHLLPAMASGIESIRQAAVRVNNSLINYVVSLPVDQEASTASTVQSRGGNTGSTPATNVADRQDTTSTRASLSSSKELDGSSPASSSLLPVRTASATATVASSVRRPPTPAMATARVTSNCAQQSDLDYAAAVSSLTLLFLNDHEATRVAALSWLIMLHRKAPRKVLAFNDGTFPALLKTLSDPAEAVVTKDLQLLSQISRNSEDDYFSNFMVNLLQLFSTDRKLLEIRGNLIIRQLCVSLSPERIYRTLANCIEKEEDVEFASIMVQNLNNNLLTAPELADLRKRLRNLETKDGQAFFVALFRSWCYNAVATFSLCLLAQAYEQAYNLLQILYVLEPPEKHQSPCFEHALLHLVLEDFLLTINKIYSAELEMTVNILIQIDKLVQLLESPVFTCECSRLNKAEK